MILLYLKWFPLWYFHSFVQFLYFCLLFIYCFLYVFIILFESFIVIKHYGCNPNSNLLLYLQIKVMRLSPLQRRTSRVRSHHFKMKKLNIYQLSIYILRPTVKKLKYKKVNCQLKGHMIVIYRYDSMFCTIGFIDRIWKPNNLEDKLEDVFTIKSQTSFRHCKKTTQA